MAGASKPAGIRILSWNKQTSPGALSSWLPREWAMWMAGESSKNKVSGPSASQSSHGAHSNCCCRGVGFHSVREFLTGSGIPAACHLSERRTWDPCVVPIHLHVLRLLEVLHELCSLYSNRSRPAACPPFFLGGGLATGKER